MTLAGFSPTAILAPSALLLVSAVVLDMAIGDPVYPLHPIRLMGRSLSFLEALLRRVRCAGYVGGCLLGLLLAAIWAVIPSALVTALFAWAPLAGRVAHVLVLYTMLALGDLFRHVNRVGAAASRGDVAVAREAIALLVGRDAERMDIAACRRGAVESLAENFVDGFLSALFWYAIGGLPGLLVFKVASTMDSMVGYKTPRYLQFGWFGARLDDVMNYVPARMTWLLFSAAALVMPRTSALKALRIGFAQHGIIPGPNPGWSEAAIAGAIQRRLIGPIWRGGALVTEIWIGDPRDPECGSDDDLRRSLRLTAVTAVATVLLTCVAIALR